MKGEETGDDDSGSEIDIGLGARKKNQRSRSILKI